MRSNKYLVPAAALAVGALSMVGFYAFAQGNANPATTAQTQNTASVVAHDDRADGETADDQSVNASIPAKVGDTDIETSDDAGQAGPVGIVGNTHDQSEHDVADAGEVEDGQ